MVDEFVLTPLSPAPDPAPLSYSIPLNPPMVGEASPFTHVDGQNRDLILESIRAWIRDRQAPWTKAWQDYLEYWLKLVEDWLNNWSAETEAWVTTAIEELRQAVINNSITLQDPVLAGILLSSTSQSRGVLNQIIDKLVISEAFPGGATDQLKLQNGLDLANTLGIRNIEIRPKATGYWSISGQEDVRPYAGQRITATSADFYQDGINAPFFYIQPGRNTGFIKFRNIFARFLRPTYAQVTADTSTRRGARALANNAGIMCQAQGWSFEGNIENFRSGVRLSNWDGITSTDGASSSTGLCANNVVKLTGQNNDFLLVWAGQRNLSGSVVGSYRHMFNTDDPGHLAYGTVHPDQSVGTTLYLDAFDSTSGSAALSMKNNTDWSISLRARSCTALLQLLGNGGNGEFTRLIGLDMIGIMSDFGSTVAGDTLQIPVRSAPLTETGSWPDLGVKLVRTRMRLTLREFPGNAYQAFAGTNGWQFEEGVQIDLSTAFNSTTPSQAAMHFSGDNNNTGLVRMTNSGGGGLNGINFAADTVNNNIPVAPMLSNCGTGVILGGASGTFVIDPSLIRPTSTGVEAFTVPGSVTGNRVITRGIKARVNRYVSFPQSSDAAALTHSMGNAGTVFFQPVSFDSGDQFATIGINITTAQAGASINFALYADDANGGVPSRLVADLGSVSAAAVGAFEVATTQRPSGRLYLCAVAQGANGVVVQGASGAMLPFNRNTLAASFGRFTPVVTGVTGAWPATLATAPVVSGVTTVPLLTMMSGT